MRRLLVFIGVIASLLILGACSEKANVDKSSEDTTVKIEDKVWEKIKEKGEIVAATEGTLFPASYYTDDSNELTGYNVEVLREIAKRLEVDIKFEIMGFDAMLTALNSNRVDIVPMGLRGENAKKFGQSEPIKYSYSTMVVRKGDHSGIEKLEDLKGKKAGGAATTVYSEIAETFGAEVVTYGNVTNDAYLRDVHNGRTDVVINDYYLQSLALTAFPEFDIEIHPDLKFHTSTGSIVMSKEATVLLDKVNDVLAEMKEDGTLTEISEQFYGGQDVSEKPNEEVIEIPGIAK